MIQLQSLRARLLLTVSIATLLIWSTTGVVSYFKAKHEADELMDGQLAQSARLLIAQVTHEAGDHDELGDITEALDDQAHHAYEQHLEFQVWSEQGRLLLRSDNAPDAAPSRRPGYSDILHAGQPWRLLSLHSPNGRYQVQVAHATQDRERVGLEVAMQVAIPILLAMPLLGILVYLSVHRALRPLERLAAEVAARSPDNLEILTEPRGLREAQPLVVALNRLLTRLATTLDNERRFTADAAHELRTPLAAVKIQAQVALANMRSADRIAEHQHALRQVLVGADRATHLVEQLLRLARLDPLASLPRSEAIDLAGLAAEIVGNMQVQAEDKQQRLSFVPPTGAVQVRGDADLLGMALRNLVENALRYTPEEGVIEVRVDLQQGRPVLSVLDSGPGVEEAEAPRLMERFYRGQAAANSASSHGSGLGLAIVQRISLLHGARLEMSNRAVGGLEVRMLWT